MLLEAPPQSHNVLCAQKTFTLEIKVHSDNLCFNWLERADVIEPPLTKFEERSKTDFTQQQYGQELSTRSVQLYFILFLSRPRLVIPRLSATVSETGH